MGKNRLRQWGIRPAFWGALFLTWSTGAASLVLGQPAATDSRPAATARHVFVPLEDLDVVFDKAAQGVILPRKQHDELQAAADKARQTRPPGGVGLILGAGDYRGRIEGEQLLLTARWEFTQFDADWQVLRLPIRNVAIESAKLDDKPAQLGREITRTGSQLVLYSKGAGKHVLQLELAAPLVSVGGDKLAGVGLPMLPAATLTLPVPAGKSLQINSASPERPASLDKPAEYRVAVGGQRNLSLRISDKHAEHSSDSLVFAQNVISVHAAAEEVTWQATASLQLFGRGVDLLEFLVPKSLEIVSVESPGLERWEAADGPDAQTRLLKLTYRQAVEESRNVVFRGLVSASLGQPWSVPTLTLKQATSQVSRIVVEHAHGLRLQLVEQTGVRRIEDDNSAPRNAPSYGKKEAGVPFERWMFSAWKPDFALLFVTQPKARELQTTISTLLDINSRALGLTSLITVESRFAPLFELELTLPAEWTITDVKSTAPQAASDKTVGTKKSIPWRIVPLEAGKHQVRIPFDPPIPASGKVQLTLAAEMTPGENWPIEAAPLQLKLPEVTLPQAAVTDGTFLIAVEDDLEALPEEVTGLDPTKTAAVAAGAVGPRLAYQYQDTHFGGRLKVVRKPQRIAVRNLGVHRLDRQTQVSHLESAVGVEGGGIRKLEVAVPESAGADLQFEVLRGSVKIVEQKPAAPANGERIWTLQFDQRVRGAFVLGVDFTSPRATDAKSVALPTLRIQGADRQDSYVALEGGPDQQLTVTAVDATGKPLVETPPDAVPAPLSYQPQERIVAAYHTVLPGYKVSVTETRFDRLGVPSALCDVEEIVSVLGSSGQVQHQATFVFRVSGVQSLIAELPEGALLWSTLLEGNPIEVRRGSAAGKTEYQIPLPRQATPGTPQRLQLLYQTEVAALDTAGKLQQEPPKLRLLTGTGDAQPLEVLTRNWRVYYPGDVRIVASGGDFEPVHRLPRSSLLGNLRFLWQNSTEMWVNKLAVVAIVFVALWALTVAFRRRRWVGFLSVGAALMIAGFVGLSILGFQSGMDVATIKMAEKSSPTQPIGGSGSLRSYTIRDRTKADLPISQFTSGPENKLGDKKVDDHPEEEHAAPMAESPAAPTSSAPSAKPAVTSRTQSTGEETAMFPDEPNSGRGGKNPSKHAGPVDTKSPFGNPPSRDLTLRNGYPNYGMVNGMLPNGLAGAPGEAAANQPPPPAPAPEPQQAAAGPQAEWLAGTSGGGKPPRSLGRLSLSLQVSPAVGDAFSDFTFNGQAGNAEPQLEVRYLQQQRASLWTDGVLLGLLWLSFCLRRISAGCKAALAICGWVLPIALTPVVPSAVLPFLDGLFLGTTAAVILWCLVGVFGWCSRCCRTVPASAMTALLLIALASQLSSSAMAQQTVAPTGEELTEGAIASHAKRLSTVIFPYDPAKDLKEAERVFLPLEKFRELWNQAHPDERLGTRAPVDGLISEALYSAKFVPAEGKQKGRVEITARLAVHSFRTEQIALPLPLGAVALDGALLDGKAAPLQSLNEVEISGSLNYPKRQAKPVAQTTANVFDNQTVVAHRREGNAGLAILLTTPGLHVIDLKFSVPVDQRGPAGSFVLPLKPVPSGLLRFTLPADGLTLQVNGGGVFRQVTQDGKQTALIPVDAGGEVTVSWAPKQAQETASGIVHVTSRTAVRLDDTGLRLQSTFDYVVRQGTLANVQFSLPEGLLVRQIASLDLAGWEVNGTGAQRTLKVFLRRPVTDKTRLAFDLYLSQKFTDETQSLTLPDFGPRGATRETGVIGLFAEKHLTMSAGSLKGLTQIEPQQFAPPEAVQTRRTVTPFARGGLPQLAYRYAARPIELQLLVARQKPRSQGESSHVVQLSPRKIREFSLLQWNLAGAPRSDVAVQLPAGYLLYDLNGPGIVDYFVESREGANARTEPSTLHVILDRPRTGKLSLLLEGIVSRNPDELALQLAVPVPLGANELRTTVGLWLDSLFTGNLQTLNGWKSIDPAQLPAWTLRSRRTPAQFGFSSNSPEPQPISLTLAKATPRLQGAAVTIAAYRETSLNYLLQLRWQIDLAGETEFIFTTPDWLADRLDFSGNDAAVRIRQVTSEKIPGGRLRWTVSLEEPQRRSLFLTARATLPPPTDGRVIVPRIVFEQRRAPLAAGGPAPVGAAAGGAFQPLERQQEYVLLVNASAAPLDPLNAKGVVAVSAGELPIRLGSQLTDQATEIARIVQPVANDNDIGWQVRDREQVKSLPATVNLANLRLVLERDGSWRCQADYRINNRERQFLAVELPEGSRILSLFVAQRPARPVRKPQSKESVYLIPLPKTAAGELAAEVRMVVAGRLPGGLPPLARLRRQEIDLPAPRVLSNTEDADFGMPVAATEWTVWFPKGFDVQPLDDPDRTNVTTTAEGYGEALAKINEMMQLWDSSMSMNKSKDSYGSSDYDTRASNRAVSNGKRLLDEVSKLRTYNYEKLNEEQRQQLDQQLKAAEENQRNLAKAVVPQSSKPGSKLKSLDSLQQEQISMNSDQMGIPGLQTATTTAQPSESEKAEASFESLSEFLRETVQPDSWTESQSVEDRKGDALAKKPGKDSLGINSRAQLKKQNVEQSKELADEYGENRRGRDKVVVEESLTQNGMFGWRANQPAATSTHGGGSFGLGAKRRLRDYRDGNSNGSNAIPGQRKSPGRVSDGFNGPAANPPYPNDEVEVADADGMIMSLIIVDDGKLHVGGEAAAGGEGGVPAAPQVGLSLPLQIAERGEKLTFFKAGGDAKLTVGVRSGETWEFGGGLLWTIVWLVIGGSLALGFARQARFGALVGLISRAGIALGLVWFFLLPNPWLGFLVFAVSAVVFAVRRRSAVVAS